MLENLLCNALEGGSNYWYMIQDKKEPREWTFYGSGSFNAEEKTKYLHLYPFNRGGALMIDDERADDPELKSPVCLNFERIEWGVQKWAEDSQKPDEDKTRTAHPRHWSDMITGNDDADTADIFLQYCIFGKVIYG